METIPRSLIPCFSYIICCQIKTNLPMDLFCVTLFFAVRETYSLFSFVSYIANVKLKDALSYSSASS